jgi:prepilin peptidase CpaA
MSLRIPNWLTVATGLLFFPAALICAMPLPEFLNHLLSGLGLFVLGFGLFQLGLFGGGDAKLMAAAGLWLGTAHILPFLIFTALAGGILALVVAGWASAMLWLELEVTDSGLFARLRELHPSVPYGLAFALGGILAFKQTWWFTGLV